MPESATILVDNVTDELSAGSDCCSRGASLTIHVRMNQPDDRFIRNHAGRTDGIAICMPAVTDLLFANGFE